ncbi:MAG TPA: 5'/3'-nucleotidase SurE [Thermodesulfovibrio thiophilus]|uniref:5'/3'-nucleotidase SurE n=1 Tax=Thermodesulfovibrio thiophilus TaxID=340095 RepID=UPI0018153CDE|nr:5'/3'-nucleotidase SurE [Thermodesulfovibrio thiophilus]HHW20893.1 5'/3'-nucleotidase SurE [Thermodesulfovibrio thiophilus]HQD35615.1 5'/3'-nucleotidase SurE [Thermodesulfovibrio thiophilus]
MPLILVTNDDGFFSMGIQSLFFALKDLGETVIVAPDRDRSAVSHALTMHRPLKVDLIKENCFSVNGTPTDCIVVGVKKILPRDPDLIISGINKGANLGEDITYSGTVSAAMEGTILGIPSFAVSLVGERPFKYETASTYALKIAKFILEKKLPKETLLNVNVPNKTLQEIKGIKVTKQGKRSYENSIHEIFSPWGEKQFWIGGGIVSWHKMEGTDIQAVMDNYVSVTPLHIDLTNYNALDYLKKHGIEE